MKGALRDVSFWYVNPRMAEARRVLMAVSEMSDMSHDVFFPCCYKGTDVCAYSEGCGLKLEPESNGVFELPVEIVPHNARTTGEKGKIGLVSSLSKLGQIEGMVITIANSEYMRCLKRARQLVLQEECR